MENALKFKKYLTSNKDMFIIRIIIYISLTHFVEYERNTSYQKSIGFQRLKDILIQAIEGYRLPLPT